MNFSFSFQFIPLVFSMFFSLGLLVYLIRYFDSPVVKALAIILKGAFIWSMSHFLEYGSNDLNVKLFWVNIGYLGMSLVSVSWLVMAIQYLGRSHFVSFRNILVISVIPLITLVLDATNSFHGLMRYDIYLDNNGAFSVIKRTPGVWYWINLIYVNILMLTGTALMLKRFFTPPKVQRKQILLLTLAIIIPWSATFISIFNIFPSLRIDPAPSMITLSVFLIVIALYPFKVFNIIPIARDFILENLSEGIVVVDSLNRVIDYNPAFSKMFNTGKIKFSMPFSEIAALISLPGSMLSKTEFQKREIICRVNDKTSTFEVGMNPVFINGGLTGRIFHFQDITEKKKLIESLNKTQKLESLGVLAGGMAHEFNNILSIVFGYAELAKISISDPKIIEYLEKALSGSDRAKELTEQLITFSKGGAPVRKAESLFPFYAERISDLLGKTRIEAVYDIQEDLWRCLIDKSQIGQVIEEVITNSKESMPAGGSIFISASNLELLNSDMLLKLKPGKYVELRITDTGTGMHENVLYRIFDPFFTTKKQGRGLGLSTCLSIIEQHDGSIEVKSEYGKGTSVIICLPAK